MKIFKFGGASVNSVERVKNLGEILEKYKDEKILVVISAMGKTTNALEKVVQSFHEGRNDEALQLFEQVKKQHMNFAKYLLVTHYLECEKQLKDFFTEVEWLLHDKPVNGYDYYYDQIVCVGELLSTALVSHYLREAGIANTWLDVRDIIRTDDNFRDSNIDWEFTTSATERLIRPALDETPIVITQGFIGSTDENESTTLGREGSDYTAAVFANILNAESQTIWKDVSSVMNADPKQFPTTVPIPALNYREVIEMSYFGAQVIHPKTIKPLQNKHIPLYVKCFLDPSLPGTTIHHRKQDPLPPIIVLKDKQVMLQFNTKDFSFVGEQNIGYIYSLFEKLRVKPNLTQNAAISFLCIMDDHQDKIQELALEASNQFEVTVLRGLELLTIRHYNEEIVHELTSRKNILLRQQTPETIQIVIN